MAWSIRLASSVRPALNSLDRALLAELRERVAEIVDDPFASFRRSRLADEPPHAWVFEYESDVVPRVTVRAYFEVVDDTPMCLALTAVRHTCDEPGK